MIALSLLIGLLIYLLLAWWAVRAVGWLVNICAFTAVTKRVSQTLLVAFFVLIPTWDVIPGWLYFKHLCDTQAEIRVLKIVEEGQEYFLSNGRPDGKRLGSRYAGSFTSDNQYPSLLHIEKHESALRDTRTGEVLGTTKEFIYRGGWFTRFVVPEAMYLCSDYKYSGAHIILWREVVKPKASSVKGEN